MPDILTPAKLKFIEAATGITEHPDEVDKGYLARELVQCTLPHRDPGDVKIWKRTNGNFTLGIQPYIDLRTERSIGLPYGSIPRLLLFWVTSEAVRAKNRRIELGNSLNDFLRNIGLSPNTGGGKRSDAKRVREQMHRLFLSRISFEYTMTKEQTTGFGWLNMDIAPKGEFWWDVKNPEQLSMFDSYIILGEAFFEAVTAFPVPLDFRALKALKQSPLALDVYAWTTYRVHRLSNTTDHSGPPSEIKITYSDLKKQFGAEYNRLDNFRAAIKEAFEKVQIVFPSLDYSATERHITLRSSKTPIPSKLEGTPTKPTFPTPSATTYNLDHLHDKARKAAPGWAIDYLENLFWRWADKEFTNRPIKNIDGLFISFCKKHFELNGRP